MDLRTIRARLLGRLPAPLQPKSASSTTSSSLSPSSSSSSALARPSSLAIGSTVEEPASAFATTTDSGSAGGESSAAELANATSSDQAFKEPEEISAPHDQVSPATPVLVHSIAANPNAAGCGAAERAEAPTESSTATLIEASAPEVITTAVESSLAVEDGAPSEEVAAPLSLLPLSASSKQRAATATAVAPAGVMSSSGVGGPAVSAAGPMGYPTLEAFEEDLATVWWNAEQVQSCFVLCYGHSTCWVDTLSIWCPIF